MEISSIPLGRLRVVVDQLIEAYGARRHCETIIVIHAPDGSRPVELPPVPSGSGFMVYSPEPDLEPEETHVRIQRGLEAIVSDELTRRETRKRNIKGGPVTPAPTDIDILTEQLADYLKESDDGNKE